MDNILVLVFLKWKVEDKVKQKARKIFPGFFYLNGTTYFNSNGLEQAGHLSGFDIHVDSSESRVGTGSGHQADGSGTRAQELGT